MRATCAAAVLQGCRDCSIDRSLKEICKAASPEKEMKKQLSKAHRDMMKVLQQRQHAEAKRRGHQRGGPRGVQQGARGAGWR